MNNYSVWRLWEDGEIRCGRTLQLLGNYFFVDGVCYYIMK